MVEQFRKYGFMIERNMFSRTHLNCVREIIADNLRKILSDPAYSFLENLNVDIDNNEILMQTLHFIATYDGALARKTRRLIIKAVGFELPSAISDVPNMRDVLSECLQAMRVKPTLFLVSVNIPSGKSIEDGVTSWHQDLGGAGKITLWTPLCDSTIANGCLYIMPRIRQKLPHRNTTEKAAHLDFIYDDDMPRKPHVPVPCQEGDTVIFSHFIPHKTSVNRTCVPRWAFMIWAK
jgi:hypothetical protein